MKHILAVAVALVLGFAFGRYTSPRVANEDGLIKIIADQQHELEVAHVLIEQLKAERREVNRERVL